MKDELTCQFYHQCNKGHIICFDPENYNGIDKFCKTYNKKVINRLWVDKKSIKRDNFIMRGNYKIHEY